MGEIRHQSAPRYWAHLTGAFMQTLVMTMRRWRMILASLVALAPVTIPLMLAFLSEHEFAESGSKTFVMLTEHLYLAAMAPLLALFFGTMLLGEDVEAGTIPYILTRPIPRSALVLGRFGAYLSVASAILLTAIGAAFGACTALGGFSASGANLMLLAHYAGVAVLALMGYGAVAVCMGALLKRPIVFGVLFMFFWQRVANVVPGAIDFLTIDKYVSTLSPKLATVRADPYIRSALAELRAEHITLSGGFAFVMLVLITAALLGITCFVLRHREYAQGGAGAG
ncbi:MAG: ABC transporter permease subunit [Nitrospiraceae bacterium]|nr:ABC transporter permease subunit [Nitrospiraceae bacterium]